MNTHRQSPILDPDNLSELQGVFDSAWRELASEIEIATDEAEQVRQELARSILSMRDLEPEVIRRTVVENMRRSMSNGKAQKC
jgi:hypothetical protein